MPHEGSTHGGPAVISAAFTSQESLLLRFSKQKLNASAGGNQTKFRAKDAAAITRCHAESSCDEHEGL